MPTIRIHNRTCAQLNLALLHICPIHFSNCVKPGETWTRHVGSVWFTFECRVDTARNRYSAAQSAQTIGLVTLTGASVALIAIPLTLTGIAPLLGPTTMAAQLASSSLVAAGASPEVLQVTTWVAAGLAKKTIQKIAGERAVDKGHLEEMLKTSSTLIDSLKSLALSNSLAHITEDFFPGHRRELLENSSPTKHHALFGLPMGGILGQGAKWWSQKFDGQSTEPNADHPVAASAQVRGVYIGYKTEYEFEWRDQVNELGQCVGFDLWNVKLEQVVK